jgi:hypothetical protein
VAKAEDAHNAIVLLVSMYGAMLSEKEILIQNLSASLEAKVKELEACRKDMGVLRRVSDFSMVPGLVPGEETRVSPSEKP